MATPSEEELSIQIETGEFRTAGTPSSPEILDLGVFGGTRPLPPIQTYQSAPGKHLTYGVNSDVGRLRQNNQDAVFTFFGTHISAEDRPDFGMFAVADGMGGHMEGEKASAITTRVIGERLIEELYLKMILSPRNAEDRPIISEVLEQAILRANDAVTEQVPDGGTTLTACVVMGDIVYVGHVGDSRAYLIANNSIEQITRDHSLVQRLIELDQLTPEEAAHHQQKNVLYRAIGQSDNLEVDAVTRRLPPGSRLLICSDGLWGQVNDMMLLETVRNAKSPQEAVDKLIMVANERGGPDNISAILIQIPG
jgi:serine/threonine protein phosphatase PrpC